MKLLFNGLNDAGREPSSTDTDTGIYLEVFSYCLEQDPHPSHRIPHPILDSNSLKSYDTVQCNHSHADYKALISLGGAIWPRLSESTSVPPTPVWLSWRAASPRS